MNLAPYRADLPFTYAFGRFAVVEALRRRPDDVTLVLWHGDMPERHLSELVAAAEAAGRSPVRADHAVARIRRNDTVHCLAQVSKREETLLPGKNHVLLHRPSHPGNVGTAIRSLVAFGFGDLALIEPRIDPWGAYVVRSSVGLRFALRCQVFASAEEYVTRFGDGRRLYEFDAAGTHELDEVAFEEPFSLLFGPEWRDRRAGDAELSPERAQQNETISVRIPQGYGVESLNLATSVSIAAYRASRPARR